MQDPVDADTKDLQVWSVKVSGGGAKLLRDTVVGSASKARVEVLVLRADMVFGSDHIRSALYHAKKAMRDGRNASESLSMETLLYASGERQLSSAIKKMSVDEGCDEVVIAQLTPGTVDKESSWQPVDRIKEKTQATDLARFGISKKELATVDPGRALDIVLEKVASVDVLKK
jgi:KEOPS complex subunit Cgi121